MCLNPGCPFSFFKVLKIQTHFSSNSGLIFPTKVSFGKLFWRLEPKYSQSRSCIGILIVQNAGIVLKIDSSLFPNSSHSKTIDFPPWSCQSEIFYFWDTAWKILNVLPCSGILMDCKCQRVLFVLTCFDTQIFSDLPASLSVTVSICSFLIEADCSFLYVFIIVLYIGIGFIVGQKCYCLHRSQYSNASSETSFEFYRCLNWRFFLDDSFLEKSHFFPPGIFICRNCKSPNVILISSLFKLIIDWSVRLEIFRLASSNFFRLWVRSIFSPWRKISQCDVFCRKWC